MAVGCLIGQDRRRKKICGEQNERYPNCIRQEKMSQLHQYRPQRQKRQSAKSKLHNNEQRKSICPPRDRSTFCFPFQPASPEHQKYCSADGKYRMQQPQAKEHV